MWRYVALGLPALGFVLAVAALAPRGADAIAGRRQAAPSADTTLSGTVSEAGTADPLAGICVTAANVSTGAAWGAETDSQGDYSVNVQFAGTYTVAFSDCTRHPPLYVTKWYDGKSSGDSADHVSVTAGGNTSGIDAVLDRGGTITGRVTAEAGGAPLKDICVRATETPSGLFQSSSTDASGAYAVGALPAGNYAVLFHDCAHSPPVYATELYDNNIAFPDADPVVVSLGVETPGIDAALAPSGSISGVITDDGSDGPLEGMCAGAVEPASGWPVSSDTSDASGAFTVAGLPGGDYRVRFWDCANSPDIYAEEWYDNEPDEDWGDLVTVVTGADTPGIDAAMSTTPLPTPSPTPPAAAHGDVDCDEDVDTVDSLKDLRHVAGLSVVQDEPCPDIGTGDPVSGDIDCDDDVDSVDGLRILRHVAALPPLPTPSGCPAIGVRVRAPKWHAAAPNPASHRPAAEWRM